MNCIKLFNFISSVEEIHKIMLCLVDGFILFAPLSKVFFDQALL